MLPEQSPVAIPRSRGLKPTIPDYDLIRQIGRGSYGDVWLALSITNVYRAVKVVWRDRFEDPEPFEREFKGLKGFAAVSLTESRHLALLHVGRNEPGGFFYYVMELADDYESGSIIDPDTYVPFTFKELRSRRGRIGADETVGLAIELSRGLAALHGKHLIHRDIKPSNVIMVGGVPKLADIGLVTSDTDAATFVGTEGFVPPEGPGSARSDIYSLGKLLYEMATGLDRKEYPRLPPNLHELADRKPLLELNEILIRACEADATRRYGSAEALLEDLYLLQAGRSVRRLRRAEKSVRRAITWAAVLAVVAGIAAAGALVERRRAGVETGRRETAEAERDLVARKMAYAGGLAQAQRALDLKEPGRARRYLRELLPASAGGSLRGLEWPALWNRAAGDPSDVYLGLGQAVWRAHVSPDGRLIAAAVVGDRGIVWDAQTHRIIRTIPQMTRLEGFSADGKWLIGGRANREQRWEAATGQLERQSAPGDYRMLGVYGAGAEISYSNSARELQVWDFDQGKLTHRVPMVPLDHGLAGFVYRAVVSNNGRFAALAVTATNAEDRSWKIEVFDVETGSLLRTIPISQLQHGMAMSSDGRRLAMAQPYTGHVLMIDVASGQTLWDQRVSTDDVDYLRFSPDNQRLAGGGKDSVVWVVDAAAGRNQADFHGHTGGVEDVTWTADGGLVSAGAEGDVRLWHSPPTTTNSDSSDFLTNVGFPALRVSPDGRYYAATLTDTSVGIVDTRSSAPRLTVDGPSFVLGFTGQSREVITLRTDGLLQRWGVTSPPRPMYETSVAIDHERIVQAELSDDQRLLVIFGSRYTTAVREMATGRTVFSEKTDGICWFKFSHNNRYLLKGSAGVAVSCMDAATGKVLTKVDLPYRSLAGAISVDDHWVAVGLDTNEVHILALPSLRPIKVLTTDTGRVNSLAASPDGRRLLVGGPFGSIHVYDSSDWRELVALAENEHPSGRTYDGMELLAISANEETLIGYRADGYIHAWDCRVTQH